MPGGPPETKETEESASHHVIAHRSHHGQSKDFEEMPEPGQDPDTEAFKRLVFEFAIDF